MDLRDEKPSRYLMDSTWAPYTRDKSWRYPESLGRDLKKSPSDSPFTRIDPFNLTYTERKLLNSGAKLQEILFMRALSKAPMTSFETPYEK